MNPRLATSASPYLRSHAGNPVAWHAWGEEAFAEARRRDIPVFISIGYSTCHWCHVMARESFEDAALAERLNERFVAIKVDREEHPEVDAGYMAAAGAFTQNLGWPLSVFATPDGGPFFAGTYFPPAPRGGMPSFGQVLDAVQEAWSQRRADAEGTAAAIAEALGEVRVSGGPAGAVPTVDAILDSARALAAREDPQFGGFWGGAPGAPKFPVATALRLLQARLVRAQSPEAAAVADRALAVMAASELRDPVEGGFFRYATRSDWTVPHYERMLTDNAQLLDVALDAGDESTARGLVSFMLEVLQRPGGGFAAAQDSESWIDGERSEGGYYQRDAAARRDLEPPAVDGKVVTGWNGLAIGALARAGARLGEAQWIDAARRAADAVLTVNAAPGGLLVRASLDGTASRAPATIADHGQLAEGLVSLAVATGEPAYAVRAQELVMACLGEGGTSRSLRAPAGVDPVLAAGGVIAPDAASDGDEPSGVAAVAGAAIALWWLGGGDGHRELAERLVAEHAADALEQPLAHAALLRAAAVMAVPPRQVVVVADDPADPLARTARTLSADVVAVVTPVQAAAWVEAGFALFAEKTQRDGRATAYDCLDFACRLPTTSVADRAR